MNFYDRSVSDDIIFCGYLKYVLLNITVNYNTKIKFDFTQEWIENMLKI